MKRYMSLLMVCLIVLSGIFLFHHQQHNQQHDIDLLTRSIQRAVVSEYALTNRYPDDIDVTLKTYGIVVDTSKYVLEYEVFASNQRPYVNVRKRGEVLP